MHDLTDTLEAMTRGAMRHFFEKRAMHPALIGTALQTPGIVDDTLARYRSAWRQLEDANRQPLGSPIHGVKQAAMPQAGMPSASGGSAHRPFMQLGEAALGGIGKGISGGIGGVISDQLKRLFAPAPSFMERKDIPAVLGQQAVQVFGKGVAEAGMSLLKDIASKAMSAAAHAGDDAARRAVLQQLRAEDSILADADDKLLMEAYHTMVRFAPTLSTDKNAVRNFLREAVMTGSGPNFATIKMLGETERTVTGQGKRD